jgi:beta-lactamase regulating signal transducer with metallopeptidase domain
VTHIVHISWLAPVLSALGTSALRSLALAGFAGLGLATLRSKSTSLRLFAWKTVLCAALAMPFLGWLLPPLSIPMPEFLHHESVQVVASDVTQVNSPSIATSASLTMNTTVAPKATKKNASDVRDGHKVFAAPTTGASALPFGHAPIPWTAVATGLYAVMALFLLVRFVIGIVLARRLLNAAQTINDPRITQRLASRARSVGFSSAPRIAESEWISVPVTVGALRSTILLPVSWRDWDDAKLNAVLAHEISHVARRDALTQCVSLLHRAIFWFSPLAWWLDRHLAILAEEASDEAALAGGADRTDYARTLLGFFESLHAAPGRVWWQGVSMAKAGQAEQRVERILAWRGAVVMNLKKSVVIAIIALAVPVVYLTAAVRPSNLGTVVAQEPAPPAPASAPLDPPAALATVPPLPAAPMAGIVSNSGIAPMGVVAPVAPPMPPAPVASWSTQDDGGRSNYGHGFSYSFGYDDDQRFVIVTGKNESFTMSGSSEDARHVEKLRKQIPGDFIWFQVDEKSYIIRDQTTVDRARKLWAPQEELGKKQEELGKQQEALGRQQEVLGEKMEQVRVNVPDMTAALDKLKAKLLKLGPSATMEQIGDLQSEIGDLQSKIGEIQSQAGEQQGKLGEEQGALGEKQGKLGEEQGELGRQQGELAEKANKQMKELLDEAIKNGKAQPESDGGGGASL